MRILYTKGNHPVPLPALIFPAAFTPNGDLYNDVLWITNLEYYPGNHMEIQDPYSFKILYETDNYQLHPWNGRMNNVITPWPGTFPNVTAEGYYTFGCFLTGPKGANHNFMVQLVSTYLFQTSFNATLGDKFKVAQLLLPGAGTPTTPLTTGYWTYGSFNMAITDFSYPANTVLLTTNYSNNEIGAGALSPFWDGTLNNDGVTLCVAGMYKWTATVGGTTWNGYVNLIR